MTFYKNTINGIICEIEVEMDRGGCIEYAHASDFYTYSLDNEKVRVDFIDLSPAKWIEIFEIVERHIDSSSFSQEVEDEWTFQEAERIADRIVDSYKDR